MKRLLSSTQELIHVLHGVANGITVQDTKGNLIFVNQAAARLMNCSSPEDALEKGALGIIAGFEYFDENGKKLGLADLPGRLALQGQDEPEKLVGYTSARHEGMRWTLIKAMPVRNEQGEVILAVNVLQDVTELKETERRLRAANARVTRLLEQTLKV